MSIWLALASAVSMGALTTIMPCPLATNVAAVSFLARRAGRPRAALLAGLLYAAGQIVAFVSLGAMIVAGLTARAEARLFLDRYVSRLVGPLLILGGMGILGLLGSAVSISLVGWGVQERARRGGMAWPPVLGALLALSFCPGTASVFFFGIVPLAAEQRSAVLLPVAYGLGAAMPVVAVAVAVSLGAGAIAGTFNRLRQAEKWAGLAAGTVFILVGAYYCLTYIFGVSLRLW